MRNILITGKDGQVGWELQRAMSSLGNVIACGREDLDLCDHGAIVRKIREVRPAIILNPAAYTAVDKAETENEAAMKINGIAPGIMAEQAMRLNAILVHFSTDYVFDGAASAPYTEDAPPNPLNAYGMTKLAGEKNIQAAGGKYLILRSSWVYGLRGNNFLLAMLRLARENKEIRVVSDQVGAPAWSRILAEAASQILSIILRNEAEADPLWGLYHLTAGGQTSWSGFAEAIFKLYYGGQEAPKVMPIPSSEYPTAARRPQFSLLSNEKAEKTFGIRMPEWDKALELCVRDMKPH